MFIYTENYYIFLLSGHDGKKVETCAESVSYPIVDFFNQILINEKVANVCVIAKVPPFDKKVLYENSTKFRLISLFSSRQKVNDKKSFNAFLKLLIISTTFCSRAIWIQEKSFM